MSGSPVATYFDKRDALAHAYRIGGFVRAYVGVYRVYAR